MKVQQLAGGFDGLVALANKIPNRPDGSKIVAPRCEEAPGTHPTLFFCLTFGGAAPCEHIFQCWETSKEVDIEQVVRQNFQVVD